MSLREETEEATGTLEEIGHPKGTLAVLLVYMLLFVLGWAGLYFFTFLPRGTPDARVGTPAIEQPGGEEGAR